MRTLSMYFVRRRAGGGKQYPPASVTYAGQLALRHATHRGRPRHRFGHTGAEALQYSYATPTPLLETKWSVATPIQVW